MSVFHISGDTTAVLTLNLPLDKMLDIDIDTLAAAANSIYTVEGYIMPTDPVTITAKANAPSITLAYGVVDYNRLAVRFSENVYANSDGTGALQPSDFVYYTDDEGRSITAVDHTPSWMSATLMLSGAPLDNVDDIGTDRVAAVSSSIYFSGS